MTYSIVARDPDSGAFGVAVQTCWFAVGAIVPWAIAGVGAVATQAMVEVSYGPKCLEKLVAGAGAGQALDGVRADDEGADVRQVAVIDAVGGVSAHTGALCIDYAGHHTGSHYSVQANMMASAGVWPAMAEAYEGATGTFPERLLHVLRAAEDAGGDARGRMSAAMLIVDGERHDHPWQGVLVDVRVDHDDRPLDAIERLLGAADAFEPIAGVDDQDAHGQHQCPLPRSDRQFSDQLAAIRPGHQVNRSQERPETVKQDQAELGELRQPQDHACPCGPTSARALEVNPEDEGGQHGAGGRREVGRHQPAVRQDVGTEGPQRQAQ